MCGLSAFALGTLLIFPSPGVKRLDHSALLKSQNHPLTMFCSSVELGKAVISSAEAPFFLEMQTLNIFYFSLIRAYVVFFSLPIESEVKLA